MDHVFSFVGEHSTIKLKRCTGKKMWWHKSARNRRCLCFRSSSLFCLLLDVYNLQLSLALAVLNIIVILAFMVIVSSQDTTTTCVGFTFKPTFTFQGSSKLKRYSDMYMCDMFTNCKKRIAILIT